MEEKTIGETIGRIRYEKKLERKALCEGLCSETTLLRIEMGDRIPDKFLLEALLQRMGKSPDKVETLLTVRDYVLQELRNEIHAFLLKEDFHLVHLKMGEYKKQKEADLPLHKQYLYKVNAILAIEENKTEKVINYLEKAIHLTFPEFPNRPKEDWLLSGEEICLLLMLGQVYLKTAGKKALFLLKDLDWYIQKHYVDRKEKAKFYPKVLYVLAIALKKMKFHRESIEICEKALYILGEDNILIGMEELLELFIEGKECLGEGEECGYQRQQLQAVREVYEEYIPNQRHKTDVWRTAIQEEEFLLCELIHENRLIEKLTQEELANQIGCEQKTISYIETGKRSPNQSNFYKIRELLKINQDFYRGLIVSEDFEIHERMSEISRLNFRKEYLASKKIFEALREELDLNRKENVQYIMWMDAMLKMEMKEISSKEVLDKVEAAIRITIPDYREKDIEKYVLSRQEVYVINSIAIAKIPLEGKEKAIEILKKILDGYKKSAVNLKYHSFGASVVMFNLASFLEECDCFEEALKIYREGLLLDLECGKGAYVGKILASIAYTKERIELNKKKDDIKKNTLKVLYKRAFFLIELMHQENMCDIIKKRFIDNHWNFEN
ncbi:MAG: helix-turn-helix transcriptional regulator [Acetivibrio sp.]